MKQMGKIIGSSLLSLLLLLGLVFSMQTTIPVVQPLTVAANDITSHPAKGEVSGNGVYGYTTDYVCNGGPMQEEHAVQNGWHITAKIHIMHMEFCGINVGIPMMVIIMDGLTEII